MRKHCTGIKLFSIILTVGLLMLGWRMYVNYRHTSLNYQLGLAIQAKNKQKVNALLDQGANPNAWTSEELFYSSNIWERIKELINKVKGVKAKRDYQTIKVLKAAGARE